MTYLLKSTRTNSILCADGEYRHESLVGPNQYEPKTWKTASGAQRAIRRPDLVVLGVAE